MKSILLTSTALIALGGAALADLLHRRRAVDPFLDPRFVETVERPPHGLAITGDDVEAVHCLSAIRPAGLDQAVHRHEVHDRRPPRDRPTHDVLGHLVGPGIAHPDPEEVELARRIMTRRRPRGRRNCCR